MERQTKQRGKTGRSEELGGRKVVSFSAIMLSILSLGYAVTGLDLSAETRFVFNMMGDGRGPR